MLGKMYSLNILCDEIRSKNIRFYGLKIDDRLVGFASIGLTDVAGQMKLHKLYVLPEFHGRGFGARLLNYCEREAFQQGAESLILGVNKHNSKAISAYRRNGFKVMHSIVTDIGGGFVMDDFIMAKELKLNSAA